MTSIRPLNWATNPLGDSALAVGDYQATVYPFADQQHWIVYYRRARFAEGTAFTPERARVAVENAITNHQIGAAA